MAGRFTALPEVPDGSLLDWQSVLFSAIKENLELLAGTRGESDLASRAIVRGDLSVQQVGRQEMVAVSARGTGFTISGSDVAGLDDYGRLVNDVQKLADDLFFTRRALDLLIKELRGQ